MKCTIVIAPDREEEAVLYLHRKSNLAEKIEELIATESVELLGYSNNSIVKLTSDEIFCFVTEQNKTYAITGEQTLWIKQRLYTLEELLGREFVRINQSCIANMSKIERFETSIGGALSVVFQNGYRDYVSRRQLKIVKERVGIKR